MYALLYGPARAIIEGTEPLHKHLLEGLLSMADRQSELTNGDELRPTDAQLAGTQLDLLRELTHEMPHTTRAVGSLLAPEVTAGPTRVLLRAFVEDEKDLRSTCSLVRTQLLTLLPSLGM